MWLALSFNELNGSKSKKCSRPLLMLVDCLHTFRPVSATRILSNFMTRIL
jgi:hypothetical protein